MTIRPQPAQAPLLLAELRFFDLPRDAWARALLRARQLGAQAIGLPPPWRWPAPASSAPGDLSDARNGLVECLQLCEQLRQPAVLLVDLQDAPGHLASGENGAAPGRQQIMDDLAALVRYQAPRGPIAALQLRGQAASSESWLRAQGWTIPIECDLPPSPEQRLSASLLGQIRHCANLYGFGSWSIPPHARSARPLLRADGSARPNFWRAKALRTLACAAGADFAQARAPSDLALIDGADIAPLAQRLAAAGVAFDHVDPGAATPERLGRYALVIAGDRAIQQFPPRAKPAGATNLAVIGGRASPHALQLAGDVGAESVAEMIEARGGQARYAWADSAMVDVELRYGVKYTYVFIHNRRSTIYNGMLTYRAPQGDLLHLHLGIGAGCAGIVMLDQDEVVGAALDGDGSEGGWLARGLTSSMTLNAGAGGVVPCGAGLLVTGPQSARFQIRRSAGWAGMRAYRLLLSGELIPARLQIEAAHVLLPYVAEDERGQTDLYVVLPADHELPAALHAYLAALLRARAAEFQYAAELADQHASEVASPLWQAARSLADGSRHLSTLEALEAVCGAAGLHLEAARARLDAYTRVPATPALDTLYRLIVHEA